MVERWLLYTVLLVLPALGLMLYLVLLSLERYWAEFNAESNRLFSQIQQDIEQRKAARRTAQPASAMPAVAGIPVEPSAEAKDMRRQEANREAKRQAMLKVDPKSLALLVKTMMAEGGAPARK